MSWQGVPCFEWSRARDKDGYGVARLPGIRTQKAHRIAWILEYGPIAEGLQVLHRCDNPPCIELGHLFLGTHAENMADKAAKGRARNGGGPYRGATHCIRGHEFTPQNTYVAPASGKRACRMCERAKHRRQRVLRAAERDAA